MPVVSAFYAALTAVLSVVLADLVIRQRMTKRISVGDGNDSALLRATRAFGNFSEYAALVIVLLALAELLGISKLWLHVYGTVFILGRVIHALGMSLTLKANVGRTIGVAATHITMIALAISLLVVVWPKIG